MKKLTKLLLIAVIILTGCKKSDKSSDVGGGTTNNDIVVTTYNPQDVTSTTAKCGVKVSVVEGLELTEIGVCWNRTGNPVVNENHISTEVWNEPFECTIANLLPQSKYYVRAYALRGSDYYYGEAKSFTTAEQTYINGVFSISPTERVCFSKGNLQYRASTNTWRFAENQYDCIQEGNSNISSTYDGWIDWFGWGTGANPTLTTHDSYAYYNFVDWGINPISNGGNTPNMWRTLTVGEWNYICEERSTPSGIRYAKGIVNDVHGIILLPDNWSESFYELNNVNTLNAHMESNVMDADTWRLVENSGAVFLPVGGCRYGNDSFYPGNNGYYWTSTVPTGVYPYYAYYIVFYGDTFIWSYHTNREYGYSVRLVCSAGK